MKDRLVGRNRVELGNTAYQKMFHQALGGWASQLLQWRASRGGIEWAGQDPMDDHVNRDWHKLYEGSVLDD